MASLAHKQCFTTEQTAQLPKHQLWHRAYSKQNLGKTDTQETHPYSHGLAPSATINIRKELRLTSLWSLWAKSDQCISRDFTTATRAGNQNSNYAACAEQNKDQFENYVSVLVYLHKNKIYDTANMENKQKCQILNYYNMCILNVSRWTWS